MSRLAGLLATLIATAAVASGSTATVAWTAPTAYSNGAALPASDIKNYTISWSRTAGGAVVGSLTATSSPVSVPVPCDGLVFSATVTTTATALYPNATSVPSNNAPYTSGIVCTPGPPTSVTVS